jgi:hypothetical protein
MGIDICAEWDGMTAAERKAQITGFSVEHGYVGYPPLTGRVSRASGVRRGLVLRGQCWAAILPRPRSNDD